MLFSDKTTPKSKLVKGLYKLYAVITLRVILGAASK